MGMFGKFMDVIGLGGEEELPPLTQSGKELGKAPAKNVVGFSAGRNMEIIVNEPRIYEDSLNIAAYLRQGKPVMLNLKYLDADSGKRLIDFVCGTAYAINGHMLKVGESIFLFTPESILISEAEDKAGAERGLDLGDKDSFFRGK